MTAEKKEKRIVTVTRESKFQGVDEQGFGDFDHFNIVKVRTGFAVGTRVKVTIEKVKE